MGSAQFGATNIVFPSASMGFNIPGQYLATPSLSEGTHTYDSGPVNIQNVDKVYLDFVVGYVPGTGEPGGLATVTSITLTGIGPNPFLRHKGPQDCPLCDAAVGAEVGGG